MSNYNSLKTTIDANIKQNGRQEITGQILNSVLNQMVTTLGAGYQFAGVATTATNPGSPDAKVFYIANGKGTYTNFGGIEVTEDEVVVLYYDTAWHKVATGIASQEKLSELAKTIEGIENNSTLDENDEILIIDDGGNEVGKINADGADFIKLKRKGNDVVTTPDLDDYAKKSDLPQTEQVSGISEAIVAKDNEGNVVVNITPEKCNFKNLHNNGQPVSILSGKSIVFDGDSICYGTSDTQGRGWASRIGGRNSMSWFNYAVSGATIATGTGKSHNLSRDIDTIISTHPTLDYLILEGGTNDADILGSAGKGVFSEYDFGGNYSSDVFYGALDTLFFKAISAYPKTKIGFIIAPKMSARKPSMSGTNTRMRREYFNAVIEACKKWGIPYLDLWESSPLNPCLEVYYHNNVELTNEENKQENISQGKGYADGQHPTYVGYDILSTQIENWIKNL